MDQKEMKELLAHGYDLALTSAPSWVLEAWVKYIKLSPVDRVRLPFLYFLLNRGTPAFKSPPRLTFYQLPTPIPGYTCASCPYAYEKVARRGRFLCSQIRGPIKLDAWCVVPHLRSEKTGWPALSDEEISLLAAGA